MFKKIVKWHRKKRVEKLLKKALEGEISAEKITKNELAMFSKEELNKYLELSFMYFNYELCKRLVEEEAYIDDLNKVKEFKYSITIRFSYGEMTKKEAEDWIELLEKASKP